jgi:hypothetical protein
LFALVFVLKSIWLWLSALRSTSPAETTLEPAAPVQTKAK